MTRTTLYLQVSTTLLVPLLFTLAGCPQPYYSGYDDDDATVDDGSEDMLLSVFVTNSTGYTFDGLGIGLDIEPAVQTLAEPIPDGGSTTSSQTWEDWGWGSSLSVVIRARDTDGDCYLGSASTTTGPEVNVNADVTFDWYQGGGCP